MKTTEELKKEQYDAKAKLHELVEFINSEEYFKLSENRKRVIQNRKICLEVYVNTLSTEIYDDLDHAIIPDLTWLTLMSSFMTKPWNTSAPITAESREGVTVNTEEA